MYIDPQWRILTIGDGDLSFSASLLKHHKPLQLTATIYDDLAELSQKYGDEHYQELLHDCSVLTGFDVTQTDSWDGLAKNSFDLVIFQFPLLPGFNSREEFEQKCGGFGLNTLNRALLRTFLLNSVEHFLDPNGAGLCYITSKDVKPYREWSIETSLIQDTELHYHGSMPFDLERFPGYRIRNVDRDKHVKDTRGITYVWSPKAENLLGDRLSKAKYLNEGYCALCRTGPFASDRDKQEHEQARKHQQMLDYEQQWQDYLYVACSISA